MRIVQLKFATNPIGTLLLQTNKMKLAQYNSLSEKRRAYILDKAGAFVAESYNKHYEFKLFQLYAFYVEVIFKTDGTLCGRRAFTAVSQLDRYLNSIDISPLKAIT